MATELDQAPWGVLTFDQRDQRAAQIIDSLTGIHTHLGDGWIADRTGAHAWNSGLDLTGPAGEHLRIRVSEGRIEVRADLPLGTTVTGMDRYEGEPLHRKITLSAAKTHAQLARDIRRRILADYEPLVERAYAAQAAEDDDRARRDALAAALVGILAPLGDARSSDGYARSHSVTVSAGSGWGDGAAGSFTVRDMSLRDTYPEMVELRVPRARLAAVAAAVVDVLTQA